MNPVIPPYIAAASAFAFDLLLVLELLLLFPDPTLRTSAGGGFRAAFAASCRLRRSSASRSRRILASCFAIRFASAFRSLSDKGGVELGSGGSAVKVGSEVKGDFLRLKPSLLMRPPPPEEDEGRAEAAEEDDVEWEEVDERAPWIVSGSGGITWLFSS